MTIEPEEPICSVCEKPMRDEDLCASDIDLGICHAACLEGAPVVNLDTGEPFDGPIDTFTYGSLTKAGE